MSFNSFSEFLAMDGHGLYVWLSYAIALGVVLINVVGPMQARKKLLTTLVRRLRREGSNG